MVLGIQLPNPQHRTKDEDSEAISDLQHQLCFSDPFTKTVTKTQLALWIWQGSLQTFTIVFSLRDPIHGGWLSPSAARGHFCHPPKTEDLRRTRNGNRESLWPAVLGDCSHPKTPLKSDRNPEEMPAPLRVEWLETG